MIVYLIGFMGSGKTTYGKRFAEMLGYSFIDTDAIIENKEGLSITEIFDTKGEDYFRSLELNVLKDVSQYRKTIVATGGGMPCSENNIDLMNNTGLTVYLTASIDALTSRLLCDKDKRPVIANIDSENLRDYIANKLNMRKPFYEQAQIIASTELLSIDKLTQLIVDELSL